MYLHELEQASRLDRVAVTVWNCDLTETIRSRALGDLTCCGIIQSNSQALISLTMPLFNVSSRKSSRNVSRRVPERVQKGCRRVPEPFWTPSGILSRIPSGTLLEPFLETFFEPFWNRVDCAKMGCGTVYSKRLCPSGLREWTQVPLTPGAQI